jgi:hypothetical protein
MVGMRPISWVLFLLCTYALLRNAVKALPYWDSADAADGHSQLMGRP